MEVEGVIIADPEMYFTAEGKAVTNFRVLNTGTAEDPGLDIIAVVAWEDLAELCNENLRKDFRVKLFGREKERWWTTSEGEKRSKKEFTIYRVQVLR